MNDDPSEGKDSAQQAKETAAKAAHQLALLDKAMRSLSALPPFSPVLNKLIASLNEDVPYSKFADLIEKDTVLTGSLLHLVNSALYARRGTISSVRHAVAILGFNKFRNAVLGMSVAKMWGKVRLPATWSMTSFNLHSAATAILSDILSQRLPVEYAEGAFIAGLLHDVGRLLIAIGLPEEYEQIRCLHELRGENGRRALVDCEQEVLGFTHVQLSERALQYWKIPQPVQDAVRDHHWHEKGLDAVSASNSVSLARIVAAADQFVHCSSVSILADSSLKVREPLLIEDFRLEPARLEAILSEFKSEYENMKQFFG